MMLQDVPNFALAFGYTNASWTLRSDLVCDYVCRVLNHLRDTGMRQCTARNDDLTMSQLPLLGLTSGYVQRATDRFPKQGSRFPWRVHQNYVRDVGALRLRGVEDDAMEFSNPMPPRQATSPVPSTPERELIA
jgi:hypothetical protein